MLAGFMINSSAIAEPVIVDLDLVGASGGVRPIVPPAKVPQSIFLSQAREVYGHDTAIAGFSSRGSFSEVYPGINMACYADEHHFEYAFILRNGADPSQIRFHFHNVKTAGSTSDGDIIYKNKKCEIYQHATIAFEVGDDGSHSTHSSLNMGGDGDSSINLMDFFDLNQEELNYTRFNIVPAGELAFGPDYNFYMSKFETTNEQLIKFLNNAEANQNNPRGEFMYFDKSGNVWINPEMQPQRDEMFKISESKIKYFPERVVGDRYHHIMDEDGNEPFAENPATGISWYGAVKYSNWLTLQSGRGLSERCYTEGTNTFDWAPATATNWASGSFGSGEREAWLKLRGFRLPMFRTYDHNSNNTNRFNEFLKAGSWNGSTNVLYGYGRNSFTNNDANALDTSIKTAYNTLPVGFFDGLNVINGARTHRNDNYYGINDLSGNVAEWVNGPARPGAPDIRSACGGSFSSILQPLNIERIAQPYNCGNYGGFRPVTTFMPDEYTQVNVLFCFHVPPGKEKKKKKEKTPLKTGEASTENAPLLIPPGGGNGSENRGNEAGSFNGPGGIVTDPNLFPPKVKPSPTPEPSPEPGSEPEPGPNPKPIPLPTRNLTVFSRNPDGNVPVDINNPDIDGHTGGDTTLHRNYFDGESVSAVVPDKTALHQFQYWEQNGTPVTLENNISVVMDSNREITAVYLEYDPGKEHTLYVDSTPADGVPITISLADNNNESDGNTSFERIYTEGATVTATAPASHGGLDFREWLLGDRPYTSDRSITVTMGDSVYLTAAYGPATTGKTLIVNSENPDSGVPINVSVPDNDMLQNGDTSFTRHYDIGSEVTLVAPAVTNKVFMHWLRNGIIDTDDSTVTVILQTDLTMTAVYKDAPPSFVVLNVDAANAGGGVDIQIGAPDQNGNTDGTTAFDRNYDVGTPTTATAPPVAPNGNKFAQWLYNGSPYTTNLTIDVTMLQNINLVAAYKSETENPQYNLTVQSQNPDSGVNISVNLPDVNNDADGSTTFERTYEEGAVTTLTAPETAEGGTKTFDHWIIDGSRYDSRSIDIAMYADHTVTAVYVDTLPDHRYVLTVQSKNPNSSVIVSIDPEDVNGQQNGSTTFTRLYDAGKHVTLTASDPAFPGTNNSFKYWERDGKPWLSDVTVSVDMTRDITVTAVYGPVDVTPHTLTVKSQGPDNGVDIQISTVDTNGLSDGHTEFNRTYPNDTDLTATAPIITTDSNGDKYEFQHWLLNGSFYTGDPNIDLTILGDSTITAVYEPYIEHTLTVNSRNPDNDVPIAVSTIDNNGLEDGSTSFDRIYGHGTDVSLTAPEIAPNKRDVFVGWERNGSIVTTNITIDLTMYDDIEVTAVYGPPPTVNLHVNSLNPGYNVNVSVTTPDINGETDGSTKFKRTYNKGQETTLTAEQEAFNGNQFDHWERNGVTISTNLSVSVTMLSDVEMTAVYGKVIERRNLVVRSINPDTGVAIGIDNPDQQGKTDGETAFVRLYDNGEHVTATAPSTAGGNDFIQWYIDGLPYATNLNISVDMYADHIITAEYGTPGDLSLYVDSENPASGVSIDVSQADNNGAQNGDTHFIRKYSNGDTTTLTAPEEVSTTVSNITTTTYFSHWERDGQYITDQNSTTVEMLTDTHMTAVYDNTPPPVPLIVNAEKRDGNGNATEVAVIISVGPSDINGEGAGETGFNRTFNYGTSVTLSAPDKADQEVFLHWERNGVPISTNLTITVEMLAAMAITAVYGHEPIPPEVTLTVRSEGPDGQLLTSIAVTGDLNGDGGDTTTYQRHYNVNTEVTLDAPDQSGGLQFDHWERGGIPVALVGEQTITFIMLSDNVVTAIYIEPENSSGEERL